MSRRFASLLLAVLIAFTGVTLCARGVQACAALQAEARDCCGDAGVLAGSDCCCPQKEARAAVSAPVSAMVRAASFDPLLAVVALVLEVPAASSTLLPSSAPAARAMAPPDTPLSLHTSLLL